MQIFHIRAAFRREKSFENRSTNNKVIARCIIFYGHLLGYLVYRMAYQALMTVGTFEIVRNLPEDAYGLIFGINVFFGLGFQTILTYVVSRSFSHLFLTKKIIKYFKYF